MRTFIRFGLVVLGLLLFWVATMLLAGTIAQLRVPVNLTTLNDVRSVTDGFVKASGTWVMEGDSQAFPLQTTEIWCERDFNRCTSATAQVMGGEQLFVHLDFFEVSSWEPTRVIFRDTTPGCVEYITTIDLSTKSATALRRRKADTSAAVGDCSGTTPEVRLTLRRGFDVSSKERNQAMPWFGEIAFAPFKVLH